jgi:hypothetical protein
MSNLTPASSFDDVVQIELTDKVKGGAGGKANEQAQALLNRTKYLYDKKADLVDGKIPATQLPSYVDDVLEYANLAAFPVTGETGKIYVALDTNLTYRWSGTVYIEISKSLALGESSAMAYAGDKGKVAYDKAQELINAADILVAPTKWSVLVDGVFKTIVHSQFLTLVKTWLDIASDTVKGLVKIATLAMLEAGSDTTSAVPPSILRTWAIKRVSRMDGSGATYVSNFVTTDGWLNSFSTTVSVVSGVLRILFSGIGAAYRASVAGKYLLITMRGSKALTIQIKTNGGATLLQQYSVTTTWQTFVLSTPMSGLADITLVGMDASNGDYIELSRAVVADIFGRSSYLSGSLSEEAARVANQGGDTPGQGAFASCSLTSNGTNFSDGDIIATINGKAYTAKAALSDTRMEGEVLIGSTYADTLYRFSRAIVRINPFVDDYNGSSPIYNVAAANTVVSSTYSGGISTLTAVASGRAGNQITVSKHTATAAILTLTPNNGTGITTNDTNINLAGGYDDWAAKVATAVSEASNGALARKTSFALTDKIRMLDMSGGGIAKYVLGSDFFAADGGTGAATAVQGNDSRLSSLGTWTPCVTIGGATTGITYGTNNAGQWAKSAKYYSCDGYLELTSKNALTGDVILTGLPVVVSSALYYRVALLFAKTGTLNTVAGVLTGRVSAGASTIVLQLSVNEVKTALAGADIKDTFAMAIHIDYFTT